MIEETVQEIVIDDKGRKAAKPEFREREIYLHPVVFTMLPEVNQGEFWQGWMSDVVRDTGKQDKNGLPIFLQYFHPVRKVTIQQALKIRWKNEP